MKEFNLSSGKQFRICGSCLWRLALQIVITAYHRPNIVRQLVQIQPRFFSWSCVGIVRTNKEIDDLKGL